jgi:hypothetical protein
LAIKFLIGGAVVSLFSELGEIFRPKSFAGLFGAAPSVALVSLSLAAMQSGRDYAATEARSMMAGAVAFLVYSWLCARALMRRDRPALTITLMMMPVWFAVALAFWCAGRWIA